MTGKQLTPKQLRKANQARREAAALKQSPLDPDSVAGLAAFNAQQKRDREWQQRLQEAAIQCGREKRTIEIEEHPAYPAPRRTAKFEYAPPSEAPPSADPVGPLVSRGDLRRLVHGSSVRRAALAAAVAGLR